jgi:PIN domain nuclease of toxin-antitoxin system
MKNGVLLDTPPFVSAFLGELSKKSEVFLTNPALERYLSAMSVMEIAVKSRKNKISMSEMDVFQAIDDLKITLLPFTPRHARMLFNLQEHKNHVDPWDRAIIATALHEGLPVMTTDRSFQKYSGLRVI